MDFECSQLSLTGIGNVPRVLSVPHAGRQHSLSSLRVKNGRSSQLSQNEARYATEQVPAARTLRLPGSK